MTCARHTDVLQQLVVNLPKQINVKIVGLEGISILAEANRFQPFAHLAHTASCSSSAFASFRSRVSNPSVNHPYTGASNSRACCGLPWSRQRRVVSPFLVGSLARFQCLDDLVQFFQRLCVFGAHRLLILAAGIGPLQCAEHSPCYRDRSATMVLLTD